MAWVNQSSLRSQLPARLATEDIQEWEQYHIPAHEIEFVGILSNTGASGQVWRAKYKNREVAVKCISLSATEGPALEALKRETVVLLHIAKDCRHACKFFGVTVKDNAFCIVMKLYPSNLSKEILQSPGGKLSVRRSLQHGIVIAKAVAELHMLGVIICDLKPDNILLDDLGDPVLTDFGLSRIVNSTQRGFIPSSMQGTPNYMSPEQFDPTAVSGGTGNAVVTEKADVWAFACTMIHMLTGVAPWNNDNIYQICCKVVISKHSPAVPHNIPADLSKLLSRCLQLTPALRPSARELLLSLTECMDALVVASSMSHANCGNGRMLDEQRSDRSSAVPSTPSPMPHHALPHNRAVLSNNNASFSPLKFHRISNTSSCGMHAPNFAAPTGRHPPAQYAPHMVNVRQEMDTNHFCLSPVRARAEGLATEFPLIGGTRQHAAQQPIDIGQHAPRRWVPPVPLHHVCSAGNAAGWSVDDAAAVHARARKSDTCYDVKSTPGMQRLDTAPMPDQASSYGQDADHDASLSEVQVIRHCPWLDDTRSPDAQQVQHTATHWTFTTSHLQLPNPAEPMDMLCSPRPAAPPGTSKHHMPAHRLQCAFSHQLPAQSGNNTGAPPGRQLVHASLERSHTAPAFAGSPAGGLAARVMSHDGSLCSSHTAYKDTNTAAAPDSMMLCTPREVATHNPNPLSQFTDEYASPRQSVPAGHGWMSSVPVERESTQAQPHQVVPMNRISANHLSRTSWASANMTSSLNPHPSSAEMAQHGELTLQGVQHGAYPVSGTGMLLPDPRAPAYSSSAYNSQTAERVASLKSSALQHAPVTPTAFKLASGNSTGAAAPVHSRRWECPVDSNVNGVALSSMDRAAEPQTGGNSQTNLDEQWQLVPSAQISSSGPMLRDAVDVNDVLVEPPNNPALWTPEPSAPCSPWVRRVVLPVTYHNDSSPHILNTSWHSSLDMPAALSNNLCRVSDSQTGHEGEMIVLLAPQGSQDADNLTRRSYVQQEGAHTNLPHEGASHVQEPISAPSAHTHLDGAGILQRQVLSYVWQLANGHSSVILHVLAALALLAQQDTNHSVLMHCGVPSAVLSALHANVKNVSIVRQALEVLHQLSLTGGNPIRIVPSMVDLLQYQDESVVHKALCILRNLCCEENNKTLAPDAGALEPLIRLLSHPEPAIVLEAAGTLKTLGTTDTNRHLICLGGATRPLLALLQHDYIPVVEQAVWTVINLSGLPANRSELLALDAHKLIHQVMQQHSEHSELYNAAAAAIRCLGYSVS